MYLYIPKNLDELLKFPLKTFEILVEEVMPQISCTRTGLSTRPWAVFVEYRTSPKPYLYSAQGIRKRGSAVPDNIRTAADFLNHVGIKITDPEDILKRVELDREKMGELYLNLFAHQVEEIAVKASMLEGKDLLSLNSEKVSFMVRDKNPYISNIQLVVEDAQELLIPVVPREPVSELILEAFFSQPRDITRRRKIIKKLIQEINQAKKSIQVAMFSFTNKNLAQALIAAKERGVKIQVILDHAQAQKPNSQIERLEKAEIEIVFGDLTMHHKSAVFDGQVLVAGSFNWTSAHENNYEDFLYLKGTHEVITQYQKRFRYLWEMFSLQLGTLVEVRNPVLHGFKGFGHCGVPLSTAKRIELILATATPEDHQKILDLFRDQRYNFHTRTGCRFRIARKALFSPLLKNLDAEFDWLRKLVLGKIVEKLWPRFFYGPASASGKYHKAHLNRIGGHFDHTREVVLWTVAFCEKMGVPKEIKNKAVAAAILHDVFPGLQRKGFSRRDHAELTADELEKSLKGDHTHDEDLKEIVQAVRHHLDIWGKTPLNSSHSLIAWILFWANFLASRPNIFLKENALTEDQIIDGLLERPFPNHLQSFASILNEDQDFLRAVTGKENIYALTPDDKRLLIATYTLLPPALLSQEEAFYDEEAAAKTLLYKKDEICINLAASLLLNRASTLDFEGLENKFAENNRVKEAISLARKVHQTGVGLGPSTDRRIWAISLANWLIQSGEVKVYSYEDLEAALTRVSTPTKIWDWGKYNRSDLVKFTRDIQRFMVANLLGDFIAPVEKGFRERINRGFKKEEKKLKPLSNQIMLRLIWRAKTLDPDKLYYIFFAFLKPGSKQEPGFLKLLREASEENWNRAILDEVEKELVKKRIPAAKRGNILSALTRGVMEKDERSLGEINTVLVNMGFKESDIEKIMEELISLRLEDAHRSIAEIEKVLKEIHLPQVTIEAIICALGRRDLKETESIISKLERILGEFEIGYSFKTSICNDLEKMMNAKRAEQNRRLEALFKESPFLKEVPQGGIIPEFELLGRAWARRLAARGGALAAEPVKTLLMKTRSLDFKNVMVCQKEMNLAKGILDQALTEEGKILVYGDNHLNGALAITILVQALRDKAIRNFKQNEEIKDYEKPVDFDQRGQRYAQDKIGYYIPDAAKEGFRLNLEVLRQKYAEGYRTVFTANNGIKDEAVIEEARKLGMAEVVIHSEGKEIEGAVLAYEFAQILDPDPAAFLDLATLGVLAMIGEMTDEDRNIVYWGLKILNSLDRNIGINTLLEIKGMREKVLDGLSFGFHIVPVLKAACALNSGREVVELFLAQDRISALIQVEKLLQKEVEENRHRENGLSNARKMISEEQLVNSGQASEIILVSNWEPLGIMGSVAARLSQEYYLPVVLIDTSGESAIGEIRSVSELDLKIILAGMNIEFGAHPRAAHFRIKKDQIGDFKRLFKLAVQEELKGRKLVPRIPISGEISEDLITLEMKTLLDVGLGPFKGEHDFGETGRPVFVRRDAILGGWNSTGSYRTHLLLEVVLPEDRLQTALYRRSNTKEFKKILFLNAKRKVDLALSIGERGGRVQLRIVDLEKSEGDK